MKSQKNFKYGPATILSLVLLAATACGQNSAPGIPALPSGGDSAGNPFAVNTSAITNCNGNTSFKIGRGVYDITGPAAELGMMGYAVLEQKTSGIHMRLRSRAFVIESPCNGNRVAFVSADLGQIFQAVKQGVVAKLSARYGATYTDANVILSATHTHSGPGGYSHYALYNITVLGFDSQNYNAVTEGIYQSIVRAHDTTQTGTIKIASGDLADSGFNRSSFAYDENPAAERANYTANTDREMTVLKFMSDGGQELGTLNWFAVHPTNIGNQNTLITSDSKGYASYWFEKDKSVDYSSGDTFVAAFAQANEGDVSPNYWGVPDNTNDYARAQIIADRQYQRAKTLYNAASTNLSGGVDYRHSYVNMAYRNVSAEFTNGAGAQVTCAAAIGSSFAAGSTEDGPGLDFISEGLAYDGVTWPEFTLMPGEQDCHGLKPILLPTGQMSPYPWTPEVLPVQIATIGNLAIIAVPFECTTMCGRRLREMVLGRLATKGITHAVIAGLSNAYAGYVTTKEEYDLQHYEGASTHFGPWTHAAWMQEFSTLAEAIVDGIGVDAGPNPRDLSNDQTTLQTGVVFDDKPLFKSFGDVKSNANSSYSKGQTVTVKFWGGHPKNNLKIQDTFLKVQRKSGSSWVTVAQDWDPETTYEWQRDGAANSIITIKWTIPADATSGSYRIKHYGNWKSGWTGNISSYNGKSKTFSVN